MYNIYVLFDTHGKQNQNNAGATKLLMWCKIRFSSLFVNAILLFSVNVS